MQDEFIGMYLNFGESRFIDIVKITELNETGAIVHFAMEVEDVLH